MRSEKKLRTQGMLKTANEYYTKWRGFIFFARYFTDLVLRM
jgi:hypothetical protein